MTRRTPLSLHAMRAHYDAMGAHYDAILESLRATREARGAELEAYERLSESLRRRGRRPPPKKKGGGSEPVTVEPNRPRLGEGGAAAALEYDE